MVPVVDRRAARARCNGAHPGWFAAIAAQGVAISGQNVWPQGVHRAGKGREPEMAVRIRSLEAAGGDVADRLASVWQFVDRDTVDRFLFHKPEVAAANRTMWRESGLGNDGAMARALEAAPQQPLPLLQRLRALSAPTLVVVGAHDRNVGVSACRAVAAALPRAALAILSDSAHFPDAEEPARYADIVGRFLRAAF